MITIVGCGGTGGWLCQLLGKTPERYALVTLIDGDKIEKRNIDRQLFRRRHIGKYKVHAAAEALFGNRKGTIEEPNIVTIPEFLKLGSGAAYETLMQHPAPIEIFCCPDNHAARNACLLIADRRHEEELVTRVVITGNESTTGSADLYLPQWRNSNLDPRVHYPEIRTDTEGDPLTPRSCTGEEALKKDPQLALYNCLTASTALWLMESFFHVWKFEGGDLYEQILHRMPVSINITASQWQVTTYAMACSKTEE